MKYEQILRKALVYYRKGREGDIEHVKWLSKKIFELKGVIEKHGDFDIVYALTILHDVGYCKVRKPYNPFELGVREKHSIESAKIARDVLREVNFPKSKITKAVYLIRHHDDWAFGKSLKEEEWNIFNDLDFSWMASKKGFDIVRRFLGESRKKFLKTVLKQYKDKQKTHPFFLKESKKMFFEDLRNWKRKIKSGTGEI